MGGEAHVTAEGGGPSGTESGTGPVGGRLRLFANAWKELSVDSWVLQTISQGYQIEFTSPPPLGVHRVTRIPAHPGKKKALFDGVKDLLAKGAVTLVTAMPPSDGRPGVGAQF